MGLKERRIAVIGHACIGPGAESPQKLWEIIIKRQRFFRIMPEERLSEKLYFDPDIHAPGKSYSRLMSLITNWSFDSIKYRIPPIVAEHYDISHWLALDTVSKLLKNFPLDSKINKDSIGVIIGNSLTGEFSRSFQIKLRWPSLENILRKTLEIQNISSNEIKAVLSEYKYRMTGMLPEITEDTLPGGMSNIISGRIANYFDFRGGAFTVDGACSSSLLSIITACNAIECGQLDFAITGGVDVSIDPFEFVGFAKTGAFSKNIIMPYDQGADGMLPGEGCALFFLADYDSALKYGLKPIAIIKGYAFSSDGKGEGITAPRIEGQAVALRKTYEKAGYSIDTVDYFEGHGTGTVKGDAVEIGTLISELRKAPGQRKQPAFIGSIKANIGHTKAASGGFAILKALLALENKYIPPTTGCFIPNAAFGKPPDLLQPAMNGRLWNKPENHSRRASVSAMGFGGSNAHITFEEVENEIDRKYFHISFPDNDYSLIMLSAENKDSLIEKISDLKDKSKRMSCADIKKYAESLNSKGITENWRASLIPIHPGELENQCKLLLDNIEKKDLFIESERLFGFSNIKKETSHSALLVFPGQGSQYYGMAATICDLFSEEREYLEKLDSAVREIIPEGILHLIIDHPWKKSEEEVKKLQKMLTETQFAQPAIVATSLAILNIIRKYQPKNVVSAGHSLGEITAMCAAGIISDIDAVKIAAVRGKLMSENSKTDGSMAAVFASLETVTSLIEELSLNISIANYNSKNQFVISGETRILNEILERFDTLKIKYSRLNVSHAFHSPIISEMSEIFVSEIQKNYTFNPPSSIIYSTVTGKRLKKDTNIPEYLGTQIKSPVKFLQTIENIFHDKIKTIVECGPKNILSSLARDIAGNDDRLTTYTLLPGIQPGKTIFSSISALFLAGNICNKPNLSASNAEPFVFSDPVLITNPLEKNPKAIDDDKITKIVPEELDFYSFAVDWIAKKTGFAKETLNLDMKLREDLGLDSLKLAELTFDLGKQFHPGEIIGNPSIFANSSIREIVDALKTDNKTCFDQSKLRNEKKASITNPELLLPWIKTFNMDMVETPAANIDLKESDTAVTFCGEYKKYRSELKNVFSEAEFTGKLLKYDFSNKNKIICFIPSTNYHNNLDKISGQIKKEAAFLFSSCKRFLINKKNLMQKFTVIFVSFYKNKNCLDGMHPGGAFLKSLNLEYSGGNFKWISLPEKTGNYSLSLIIRNELLSKDEKVLFVYDNDLKRKSWIANEFPVNKRMTGTQINKKDVVLVTGGAKGVTFELGFKLAQTTGCTLVLAGSTSETDILKNSEAKTNFVKLKKSRIDFKYFCCDLSDKKSIGSAINRIKAETGEITGILHGAGISRYNLFRDVKKDDFDKCINIKVHGFLSILELCNIKKIKFVHLVSSILAKTGMRLQTDYTYANAWLDKIGILINSKHPEIQTITLGYTIWDGTGMGKRDSVIEYLKSVGVVPISISEGTDCYKLLFSGCKNICISAITGRLSPDLEANLYPELPIPQLRFCERILRQIPHTEIITQNLLSMKKDLYLKDHIFNGTVLMPLVMSVEALVQNAGAAIKNKVLQKIENISINKPIIISEDKETEIRIICVVDKDNPDKIHGVIKSENDGFKEDVVSADIIFSDKKTTQEKVVIDKETFEKNTSADKFYPYPLFQGPFFRHLTKIYKRIENKICIAGWEKDEERKYFSSELPQNIITDPSLVDSMMQAALIMSGKTLLPVSVKKLSFHYPLKSENGYISAEKSDMKLYDSKGKIYIRIEGIETKEPEKNRRF